MIPMIPMIIHLTHWSVLKNSPEVDGDQNDQAGQDEENDPDDHADEEADQNEQGERERDGDRTEHDDLAPAEQRVHENLVQKALGDVDHREHRVQQQRLGQATVERGLTGKCKIEN